MTFLFLKDATPFREVAEWGNTLLEESLRRDPAREGPSDFDLLFLTRRNRFFAMHRGSKAFTAHIKKLAAWSESYSYPELRELQDQAARRLAEEGASLVTPLKKLRVMSVAQLDPWLAEDIKPIVAKVSSGSRGMASLQAQLTLRLAEVLLHPASPRHASFTYTPRLSIPRRPDPAIVELEKAVRRELADLSLPDAYTLLRKQHDHNLSRAAFLEHVVNQLLLQLKRHKGTMFLLTPRVEPWEVARYVLEHSAEALPLEALRQRAADLCKERGLHLRRERTFLSSESKYITASLRRKLVSMEEASFVLMGTRTVGLPLHLENEVPREAWPRIQDACAGLAREWDKDVVNTRELLQGLSQSLRETVKESTHLLGAVLSLDENRRFTAGEGKLEFNVITGESLPDHLPETGPYAQQHEIMNYMRDAFRAQRRALRAMARDMVKNARSNPDASASTEEIMSLCNDIGDRIDGADEKMDQLASLLARYAHPASHAVEEMWDFNTEFAERGIVRERPLQTALFSRMESITPDEGRSPAPGIHNPYRRGSTYHDIFDRIANHPGTADDVIKYLGREKGLDPKKARYSLYVVTSPRQEGETSNPWGHRSAKGHLYYVEKDDQGRLVIHQRETPLPPVKYRAPLDSGK